MFKNLLKLEYIGQFLLISLIILLFLYIDYVLITKNSYILGIYSDFTTLTISVFDILLAISIIFVIYKQKSRILLELAQTKYLMLGIVLLLALVSILAQKQQVSSLNWWYFTKLVECFVLYGTVSILAKGSILRKIPLVFVCLAIFESLLGIYQFAFQRPLGLYFLGEKHIDPTALGFAKFASGEAALLRAYGTFPHPNLLSAFLVLAFLFALFLLITERKKFIKALYSASLYLITLGLFAAMSRAALIALLFGTIALLGYLYHIYSKERGGSDNRLFHLKHAILTSVFVLILSFLIFKPYILPRATISDSAASYRATYFRAGLKMVGSNPLVGTGIGDSLLHMKQYSSIELPPWDIQPVHNYFLLAAAELGVVAAAALLAFLLLHLKQLWSAARHSVADPNLDAYRVTLAAALLAFLVLMQFDHYFYTLPQAQMLLWLVLGLAAAELPKAVKS